MTPRSDTRYERTEEAWREETFRSVLQFSSGITTVLPVDPLRLRNQLGGGQRRDHALSGAMRLLGLNVDHLLIVIGAFIAGGAYALPPSEHLQEEVEVLRELGLVQPVRTGQPADDWSGLTACGYQFAVYALYRILAVASDNRTWP